MPSDISFQILNKQRWRWWINKSQKMNMHEYYVFIHKKIVVGMQKEIEEITWELKRMRWQRKTFYFARKVRTKYMEHALFMGCRDQRCRLITIHFHSHCLCCIVREFSINITDPIKPNKSQDCSMLVFNLLRYDLFNWPAILNANDSVLASSHWIDKNDINIWSRYQNGKLFLSMMHA